MNQKEVQRNHHTTTYHSSTRNTPTQATPLPAATRSSLAAQTAKFVRQRAKISPVHSRERKWTGQYGLRAHLLRFRTPTLKCIVDSYEMFKNLSLFSPHRPKRDHHILCKQSQTMWVLHFFSLKEKHCSDSTKCSTVTFLYVRTDNLHLFTSGSHGP